jgi:hypothetical protein
MKGSEILTQRQKDRDYGRGRWRGKGRDNRNEHVNEIGNGEKDREIGSSLPTMTMMGQR